MRRSNTSQPDDLAKVLRCSFLKGLDDKRWLEADLEKIVDIIIEMVLLTPRPTMHWSCQGALRTWQQLKSDDAKLFGQRMAAATSMCFQNKRQMSTGTKDPQRNEKSKPLTG